MPDDNDFYIFGSFGERHLADLLTGATVLLGESPRNDLQRASDQGARQIGHGLRAGFYGEILTHEQKLGVLALGEWDEILAGVKRRLDPYGIVQTDHGTVGDYLLNREACRVDAAELTGGAPQARLVGKTASDLWISLFCNVDDAVERSRLRVPAFEGEVIVSA